MLLGALSLAEIESSLQRPQHPNLTGKDGRIGRSCRSRKLVREGSGFRALIWAAGTG